MTDLFIQIYRNMLRKCARRLVAILSLSTLLLTLLVPRNSFGDEYLLPSEERKLSFPRDHGAHPDYRTEWWYFTGHLKATTGETFGFELTFFRVAQPIERHSPWGVENVFVGHFALTDDHGKQFRHWSKHSRDSYGLATASDSALAVTLHSWQAVQNGGEIDLRAFAPHNELHLQLAPRKPPSLHGQQGYSRKGPTPAESSMYYSLSRLEGNGKLVIAGINYEISHASAWMDHEFFSAPDHKGSKRWDWFALQLDNNEEIMLYQLRDERDHATPFSAGTYVRRDGAVEHLTKDDFSVRPLDWWVSPATHREYPSGWELQVKGRTFFISPTVKEQELAGNDVTGVDYWEGRCRVTGDVGGAAYVELVGYSRDGGL